MCTVDFDSQRNVEMSLHPSGCILYGTAGSSGMSELKPCANYVTPPPMWQAYCQERCSNCDSSTPYAPNPCDPQCRQWCECIYPHTYVDNSSVWERMLWFPAAIIGTGARQPAKDVFRTPRSDADPSPTATVMSP